MSDPQGLHLSKLIWCSDNRSHLSLGLGVSLGNVGMVLFVPGAATYLAAACAMRAVARSRRAFAVDRAIDLEAWRINQQRLTFHFPPARLKPPAFSR